ncbi:DNA polymerase III subunit alpha [Notoacmeibacter marinus]|uniref:DNA polymerase III subunit alpha n=1 Tax=Notoacmeibacter marinus TaxID=1876515 RepID=A0A231UVE2_9HYPH|nr:DNA polymerase III subunit alpha [Notoacmeibacter marinus]OXS99265.1 DNA polymerase III subunit alpha [Notoacmeibacter marinus]
MAGETQTMPRFVHLRVHSQYSLLEGALPVDKIIKGALADQQPAIAIADTGNLFGALEFSEKAAKAGLQPILGCQLAVEFGDGEPDQVRNRSHVPVTRPSLVLIAATEEGWANLVRLVSRSYLEVTSGEQAHLTVPDLQDLSDGIICLTGGPNGPVGTEIAADRLENAKDRLNRLARIFGDRLYVELQRPAGYDGTIEYHTVRLAYDHDLPLVATNEAFFPTRDDYEAHDALVAIAEGTVIAVDERRRLTPDHHLRSQDEMNRLFSDLPEAAENTVEIARRCSVRARTCKPILPRFAGADVDDPAVVVAAEAAELAKQAHEGLTARLAQHGPWENYSEQDYRDRLDYELGVIERMGFPGYFLIVSDFIKYAKGEGIPVGPGRGSGAGSVVAWALTITDLDPLRFSLLFERFLNPERVSMPDFDIDFCQERREEVITYVQQKYGRDQVAQIITFGSLQARAVLRDVGRVLQMPYGQVDRLCKLVPANPANPVTLAKAVEDEVRFAEEIEKEPVVGRLIEIAKKLEGLYRHASTHAAGIVIGDRPLSELVPMYRDQRSEMPVTQYNMKWVEQAGLVKFDFLGLKTLTVLDMAVRFIARKGEAIDLGALPLDDEPTYEMLSRGETVGVFQVESAGMRKALLGMKPDCIEDIIALVALYRPGPMENIPLYNDRKHGQAEVESIHPKIDHLVEETQGVIVYQEQVMQIAQELAGYSLGEADLLRRAMGKKIRAEMDKQRVRFVDGAVERGVAKPKANQIFDLLAKFADYGFNKSHAAAYAIVSYQTAFLKAHHPAEFLAASMTFDMANTDKLNEYRRDAERLEIEVRAPDVRYSHHLFEVRNGAILYSLSAIKGVGEAAVHHIVEQREALGGFDSLADFCEALDPRIVGKRVLESLICAGALDGFGERREAMIAGLDRMIGLSQRTQEKTVSGQDDFFGSGTLDARDRLPLPGAERWSSAEKLHREYQAAGFYISAHPLDEYKDILARMRVQNWADFANAVRRGVKAGRLAGTVTSKQERRTRTGSKMGIVMLSDPTGTYEAVLYSEQLVEYRDLLEPGRPVLLTVTAENRPEGPSVRIGSLRSLDEAAESQHSALRVFLRGDEALAPLQRNLAPRGEGEICLVVLKPDNGGEVELALPGRYRVSPSIASSMKALPGVVDVELV